MATLNINVDLDYILNDLSSREKQKLADLLFEEDYIPNKLEMQVDEYYNKSVNESEFISNLLKIKNNYISLSNEENGTTFSITLLIPLIIFVICQKLKYCLTYKKLVYLVKLTIFLGF